jgi:hypothetical protein
MDDADDFSDPEAQERLDLLFVSEGFISKWIHRQPQWAADTEKLAQRLAGAEDVDPAVTGLFWIRLVGILADIGTDFAKSPEPPSSIDLALEPLQQNLVKVLVQFRPLIDDDEAAWLVYRRHAEWA